MTGRTPDASASAPAAHPYRPDIDGLRAVAIALVVAHHAFPRFVADGFTGIDVFFVSPAWRP
jgi:peptidoglycan/LPS O-acetylase OafA/YrhL